MPGTAGLIEIMDALADQVRGVMEDATLEFPVQVEGRQIVTPTPPTVDMYPGDSSRFPDSAGFALLDDQGGYQITVRVRAATADGFAQQDLLLKFMDDTSTLCIAAAVQDDPTLGGLASSVTAINPTGFFPDPWSAFGTMIAFTFTCVVLPAVS
jgi:hypothetical protein